MGNVNGAFLWRETLDVANGEAEADVTFVVGLPVLHKVGNVLDVNAGARNLPKTGVGWLAAGARIALVTRLLEELASEARAQLADFVSLLSLIWPQRSTPPSHTLLARAVLLGGVSGRLLLDRLGWFGACGRFPPAGSRWRADS